MFQIWEDMVEDYALVNVDRGTFTWIGLHSDDDDKGHISYDFLEESERSDHAITESPVLSKTGENAPKVIFTGTEDECLSFAKTMVFMRS